MLQNIYAPVLGSNGPLWSLANEWWYYCLFFAATVLYFCSEIINKIGHTLFLGAMFYFLPVKILLWMLIWLLGVAIMIYAKSSLPKPSIKFGMLIFLISFCLSRLNYSSESIEGQDSTVAMFTRDFFVGFSYSILLLSIYCSNGKNVFHTLNKTLADFSYSTYLVHFPFMVLMASIAHDRFHIAFLRQPNLYSYMYLLPLIALAFIYWYLFCHLTENHIYKVKSFMNRHIRSMI